MVTRVCDLAHNHCVSSWRRSEDLIDTALLSPVQLLVSSFDLGSNVQNVMHDARNIDAY